MFLVFFLLISQALFYVSTVSRLLYRKLSLSRLSVLHIFVNSVKVLTTCMHRPVCVPPFTFVPGTFTCNCEWPTRDSKDLSGKKACPSGFSLPSSPSLPLSLSLSGFGFGFVLFCFFFGNSGVCWHPAVLSHLGSHLLLLIKLGLLLAPVLLEWWSVSGSTMVPWVLPVGLRGTGRHAMYFIKS